MAADSERARFWKWFRTNSDRIWALIYSRRPDDREAAMAEVGEAVEPYMPGLVLEFSQGDDEARELVASADGKLDRVDMVKEFVASAPQIPGWSVRAFRPRMEIADSVEI